MSTNSGKLYKPSTAHTSMILTALNHDSTHRTLGVLDCREQKIDAYDPWPETSYQLAALDALMSFAKQAIAAGVP